jgi:hypothetical protein
MKDGFAKVDLLKVIPEEMTRPQIREHFDITCEIRNKLAEKGVDFTRVSWIDTQDVVEAAVTPYVRELHRLRSIIYTMADVGCVIPSPSETLEGK